MDCKPKAVITCNAVRRGSKVIHLKEIVDASLVEAEKSGVTVGMLFKKAITQFWWIMHVAITPQAI